MFGYILRRIALGCAVLLLAISTLYVIVQAAPGDPASAMLGPKATPAIKAAFAEKLGLDQPMPVQIARYVGSVLSGDLGTDLRSRRPVTEVLAAHAPYTVELILAALVIAAGLGIPLGCAAAVRRNSFFDRAIGLLSVSLISVPPVIIAIYGMLLFSAALGWLPAIGAGEGLAERLHHLILPAVAVGIGWVGYIARLVRASMIEVLSANYIRNARAFGLAEGRIVYRYALRTAVAPTVTVLGVGVGYMLGSAVFAEIVFARPGIGKLMYDAVILRNYPVTLGAVLAATTLLVAATTLADILNALIDPRFKESRE
ncbi:ABC transporter permease [Defluviimonas sp. WL0050]|uniref:ABC transporter permease n=1 Tax=Albidovulum litorale TaxID=2984134 RepID=A0ABT2ZR95_9RHOB|nr:ABC transporter permease [Defluviimonas sp. WL0050]MCV2873680.1 ABC transporter permease [Defluviimonas sp. WL0050]